MDPIQVHQQYARVRLGSDELPLPSQPYKLQYSTIAMRREVPASCSHMSSERCLSAEDAEGGTWHGRAVAELTWPLHDFRE